MVDGKRLKALGQKLLKNKYVLLALLFGLLLILWPTGSKTEDAQPAEAQGPAFSLESEEARLEGILSKVSGAGKVIVRLSLAGGTERELAQGPEGALVINGGDGEEAVELRWLYPEYLGAVIVCSGADTASVRLAITEAVSNYTGLKSNRITVIKMSN